MPQHNSSHRSLTSVPFRNRSSASVRRAITTDIVRASDFVTVDTSQPNTSERRSHSRTRGIDKVCRSSGIALTHVAPARDLRAEGYPPCTYEGFRFIAARLSPS
jgi:hypothetical protein